MFKKSVAQSAHRVGSLYGSRTGKYSFSTRPTIAVGCEYRSRWQQLCLYGLLPVLLVLSGCGFNPTHTASFPTSETETQLIHLDPDNISPGSQDRTKVFKIPVAQQQIDQSTITEGMFLGNRRALKLRQLLSTLPPEANDLKRLQLRFALGNAEASLGNEQQAIEHFETAYSLLPVLKDALNRPQIEKVIYRLGLSHMRRGETQNCCQRHTAESCIFPIRGTAIHTKQKGSREAIRYFTELLDMTAGTHQRARWLLNIAYMTIDGYPQDVPEKYLIPPETFASEKTFPRFKNVAGELGLNTYNLAGTVVIDDFDGDGWPDILSSSWDPREHIHFFKNRGNGSFLDQSIDAGLADLRGGINMVQADYDNDGDLDVYILRGSWLGVSGRRSNTLLQNNGAGKFQDVTLSAGLGSIHYPAHSASWADYDNDGDLDLYVGNENLHDGKRLHSNPVPSQLFRNNGNGTFTDVADRAGVTNLRFAKAVVWGDYNNDRFPDLYISNYSAPNRLYHNNGDGTFTDVAADLDVDRPIMSFPAWFWDVDNDGQLDLYVPSYRWQTGTLNAVVQSYLDKPSIMSNPRLYRGTKQHRFKECAEEYGLSQITLPMGANFGDLDNDGFLDFYLGTGYPDYEALMPNVMYQNRKGKSFDDVTFSGGFGHLQKGHGIAFADLDLDGDQEVIAQMGGFYESDRFSDVVFDNPGFGNHWIKVKLRGTQSNRSAIGARICVVIKEDEKERSVYKHVNSGGSFGSNPLQQSIGLGKAAKIERLEVYWPTSDSTQTFTSVPLDQTIEVTEGQAELKIVDSSPVYLSGSPIAP